MNLLDRLSRVAASPDGKRIATRLVDRAEVSLRLTMSHGKARGGGQSSKAKGRAAVALLRDLLVTKLGIPADAMMVKATSMPGVDLYVAPHYATKFPFSPEVKCTESFSPWASMAQAEENAEPGKDPIVFFKRARTQMYVMVSADVFLEMQATINGGGRV